MLAAVVRLLETTLIRVGNDEYARANNSYGLTTMRDRHVNVNGKDVRFHFRGKGGKEHSVDLRDRRLARLVKQCRDIPGYELFQYFDDNGERRVVDSGDVNDYLREIAGMDFSAKDFRTWAGTVLASIALQELDRAKSEAEAKHNVVRAIARVAERLGNTPAVCRKCYIHPAVIDAYMEGSLLEALRNGARAELGRSLRQLEPEEAAVLVLLHHRLEREAGADRHDRRRKAS